MGLNIDRVYYICVLLVVMKVYFFNIKCLLVYESEFVGFDGSFFYNVVVSVDIECLIEDVCYVFK